MYHVHVAVRPSSFSILGITFHNSFPTFFPFFADLLVVRALGVHSGHVPSRRGTSPRKSDRREGGHLKTNKQPQNYVGKTIQKVVYLSLSLKTKEARRLRIKQVL